MGDPVNGDDAWIEAELERELLELGSVEDVASDEEDAADLIPNEAAGMSEPSSALPGVPEAGQEAALPPSFRELMQCMAAWGEDIEEDVTEAVQSAQQLTEDVEKELQAPPVLAWGLENLDSGPAALTEEEKRTLEGITASVLAGRAADQEALTNNAEMEGAEARPDSSARPLSPRPNSPPAVSGEGLLDGEEFLTEHVVVEDVASPASVRQAEAPSAADVGEEERRIEAERLERIRQLELEQEEADRRLEEELARAKQLEWAREEEQRRIEAERLEYIRQLEREQQEEQRRIEAERLEYIRQLEREQQETLERMQREEKKRREEERRYFEMMAMHSEEIRCQEFYEAELESERRELRALAREDRRSAQVREEERQIQECAERRREAATRAAMAKEDALSTAMRRVEWERREAQQMEVEAALSKAFNEEMRRLEELRRLARADAEAWRWREARAEEAEAARMAAEDAHTTLLRQCDPGPTRSKAAKHKQKLADPCFPEMPQCCGAEAASEALAALMAVPAVPDAPAKSSQPPRPLSRSGSSAGKLEQRAGHLRPESKRGSTSSGSATPSGRRAAAATSPARRSLGEANRRPVAGPRELVDPWDDIWDEEYCPQQAGGASASSTARPRTGGGASSRSPRASLGTSASPRAGGARAAGAAAGWPAVGAEERRSTCGNLLCSELHASAAHWNGKELATRPRPAPPPDFGPERGQRVEWTPALRDAQHAAADELAGVELGVDCARPTDVVRLELRQENLNHIPDLSFAPSLRVLVLSGNELSGHDVLRPLQACTHLEELSLCQNSLTSLGGLEKLEKLTVLRATMNRIVDTDAISQKGALRELELSKNRLNEVRLHAPGLAKLVLYRNALTSAAFLEHLPSLTELDLGRNMLTTVDAAISDWNPLLVKVYLYENHLTSLPKLRLPLLTDLWLDNNKLEALGPLGFLPSLERIKAKDMQIRTLASPIAASPLLQTLDLAFNRLGVAEPLHAVPHHPRLQRLQLNDNPLVEDLLDGYRAWALRLAPQLLELDNEAVTEAERNVAILARAVNDPHLPHHLAIAMAAGAHPVPSLAAVVPAARQSKAAASSARGLLDLTALVEQAGESEGLDQPTQQEPVSKPVGFDQADAIAVQRASVFAQWCESCRSGQSGACETCPVAAWCEMLTSVRVALSVPHNKEEKRRQTMVGSGIMFREEVLFALRRRREFWTTFLDLCWRQHASLSPWHCRPGGAICLNAEMEVPGAECSRQRPLCRVQARWRGVLARKACARRRLDLRCGELAEGPRRAFAALQARWRGAKARESMRADGLPLPCDRRRERHRQAAMQLQAAFRGSSVRRRLRWAREMARVVDDKLDEVHVDNIIGITDDLDFASPFAVLQLPELAPAPAPAARRPTPRRPDAGLGGPILENTGGGAPLVAAHVSPRDGGAPLSAWATPPPTAGAEAGFPGITPQSNHSAGSEGLRRSRSLSSTAESAITEVEGNMRGLSRIEQAKEDWGFQDTATAKAWLNAQKNRQRKPPPMPSQRFGGGAAKGAGRGNQSGRGRGLHGSGGSRSQEPVGRSKSGALKAQDAIAAWRMQEETQPGPMEFQSGEPNLKLMRSSRGLQTQLSSSPRARSPRRLAS